MRVFVCVCFTFFDVFYSHAHTLSLRFLFAHLLRYLMYSGIFVILGIGADDIFVLSDAFKQASLQPPHISGSLETRFAWAYNRAASAMLATSLTTCAAFASCAVSPIWDIAAFGCVAATMILADYLLVITWLPAAMIVNERYLQVELVSDQQAPSPPPPK